MDISKSLEISENLVYFAKLRIQIEYIREVIWNLARWLEKYSGIYDLNPRPQVGDQKPADYYG